MRLNKCVRILLSVFTILMSIYYYVIDGLSGFLMIIAFLPIIFVPKIITKIFKIEFVDYIETFYYVFMTLAVLFGLSMHFYKILNGFDMVVHTISGILFALLGLLIINQVKKNNGIVFKLFYCFIFSMASSAIWEVIEFLYDNFFNGNMQRIETGVVDTMKDIICHLIGTVFFIIWYIYVGNKHKELEKGVVCKKKY